MDCRSQLEERVAIIAGAGRGIGKAIAKGLAGEGAIVCCTARTESEIEQTVREIRSGGGEGFAVLGDLTIDHARRRVTVSGVSAPLTPTEFDLLAELAAGAGRVVAHDRLLRRVWSPGKPGNLRVLRTHLMRLRRKLGEDGSNPKYIFAEPRVGYLMPKGETVGEQ